MTVAASGRVLVGLPGGAWRVVVAERSGDRSRRGWIRDRRPGTVVDAVSALRFGWTHGSPTDPERQLCDAVATAAGLPPGSLPMPDQLVLPSFVLVDGVPSDTAQDLATQARQAGFDAHAEPVGGAGRGVRTWALLIGGAALVAGLAEGPVLAAVVAVGLLAVARLEPRRAALPVAFHRPLDPVGPLGDDAAAARAELSALRAATRDPAVLARVDALQRELDALVAPQVSPTADVLLPRVEARLARIRGAVEEVEDLGA